MIRIKIPPVLVARHDDHAIGAVAMRGGGAAPRRRVAVQAAGRFTRSAKTLRNFSTFGATTARQ